jgi:hypothetical protein
MTPKEKAEELKEKCDGYACYADVVVDEIIKILQDLGYDNEDYRMIYQLEVKQELDKL